MENHIQEPVDQKFRWKDAKSWLETNFLNQPDPEIKNKAPTEYRIQTLHLARA